MQSSDDIACMQSATSHLMQEALHSCSQKSSHKDASADYMPSPCGEGHMTATRAYRGLQLLWLNIGNNVAAIPDLAHCQVAHALLNLTPKELGILQLNCHACILALMPVVEFVIVLICPCK